ncbi:MAG TPA: phosphatase PAP2 family protein [Actinomycetota bacterium]|nr:phosphatase PAP2 family protein [Actinomycetota bacterium]
MRARSVLRAAALGGAALAVGAWSSSGPGRERDLEAFREGNRDRGPGADRFFRGVTELGSIWASVGAAAVLAVTGQRRAAARGLAAASIAWVAGQGLKRVFGRPRPYDAGLDGMHLRIARPNGTSWPSSHPAVLLSFLTVTSKDLGAGAVARTAMDGLATVIGASRVYVGVHFPSDVAGGILLGKSVAAAFDGDRR